MRTISLGGALAGVDGRVLGHVGHLARHGLHAGIHGTGTWYEDDPAQPGIVVFPCEGQVHFD